MVGLINISLGSRATCAEHIGARLASLGPYGSGLGVDYVGSSCWPASQPTNSGAHLKRFRERVFEDSSQLESGTSLTLARSRAALMSAGGFDARPPAAVEAKPPSGFASRLRAAPKAAQTGRSSCVALARLMG